MASYTEVLAAGPGWTRVRDSEGNVYTLEGARNWRNNNPGNIEYGDFARSLGAVGTDGRFAVFPTYEAGRTAKQNLIFGSPSYRDLTLSQAINRYAPPHENNTQNYINTVARASGVNPNTRMSDIPSSAYNGILDAMERVEGFRVGQTFNAQGQRLPPADIPNAVASRLDVTPPRATTGFPTPMPNELRAQRTLMQSLANPQPAADPYRGIYQPARLTAPGAVNQSVQGAQSGQNSQLAQSLHNYANRQTPRSSTPLMSYAGQDRAPPSNRRLTDAELARVPVSQGTFVPAQTRLPPIRQAPVAQMTRSEQRADNGQVRQPARPVTPPSRPVGTQASSPIQEQRTEQLAMRNRQPARSVVPPTAAQLQAGTGFRVPNLATQPATAPKAQDRLLPNPISAPALVPAPAPVAPRPAVVAAPTPAATGFPTPIGQRPVIAAPPLMAAAPPVVARPAQSRQTTRAPLRITVQRDPAFAGSSTGAMYQPGQVYNLGGNPLMAQANRTFTNTNTGQVLPGSSGLVRDMDISGRSRRSRDALSPSQSLSGNW